MLGRPPLKLPVDEIAARYEVGESAFALACVYGVGRKTIERRLHAAGTKLRARGFQLGNTYGPERRGWRKPGGPLCASKAGYLSTRDRTYKLCYIHRGRYEACYGEIPEGHVIHHIDGNRQHNEIDNLLCMSKSEHAALHGRARAMG